MSQPMKLRGARDHRRAALSRRARSPWPTASVLVVEIEGGAADPRAARRQQGGRRRTRRRAERRRDRPRRQLLRLQQRRLQLDHRGRTATCARTAAPTTTPAAASSASTSPPARSRRSTRIATACRSRGPNDIVFDGAGRLLVHRSRQELRPADGPRRGLLRARRRLFDPARSPSR